MIFKLPDNWKDYIEVNKHVSLNGYGECGYISLSLKHGDTVISYMKHIVIPGIEKTHGIMQQNWIDGEFNKALDVIYDELPDAFSGHWSLYKYRNNKIDGAKS